jgi:hypothetical protein
LIFSTYFGGNTETCTGGSGCRGKFGITNANALALDLQGNIVIAGGTSATDLPVTAGTLSQQCGCAVSTTVGFAAKLAAGGGSLLWSTYLNSATEMVFNLVVHAVALDGSGDVIVAGNAANGLPPHRALYSRPIRWDLATPAARRVSLRSSIRRPASCFSLLTSASVG